jgi:hypothetical protein
MRHTRTRSLAPPSLTAVRAGPYAVITAPDDPRRTASCPAVVHNGTRSLPPRRAPSGNRAALATSTRRRSTRPPGGAPTPVRRPAEEAHWLPRVRPVGAHRVPTAVHISGVVRDEKPMRGDPYRAPVGAATAPARTTLAASVLVGLVFTELCSQRRDEAGHLALCQRGARGHVGACSNASRRSSHPYVASRNADDSTPSITATPARAPPARS